MSLTLPAQFHRMLRNQAAVLALRYPAEGGWRSLTWGEVLQRVEAAAFALRNLPRTPWRWRASDPGQRLVVSLALLHLGVPGEEGEGNPDGTPRGERDLPREAAAPRGFLQQRLLELRPRDPGWAGKDQGTLAAEAERRAPIFAGREVLVSAAEVEAGFAAAWAGGSMVVGGPECLPLVAPEAWITDAGGIERLGVPSSRVGPLGRFVRRVGRAETSLGPNLREVWVVGNRPGNPRPLTDRGVQLRDWGI